MPPIVWGPWNLDSQLVTALGGLGAAWLEKVCAAGELCV